MHAPHHEMHKGWNGLKITQYDYILIQPTEQNHYLDPEKGGHTKYITGTASYFRRKFDERPVEISNMRGHEDEFDLNTQGFQYYESPTVGGDFRDAEKVKKEVYPETEELLKKV